MRQKTGNGRAAYTWHNVFAPQNETQSLMILTQIGSMLHADETNDGFIVAWFASNAFQRRSPCSTWVGARFISVALNVSILLRPSPIIIRLFREFKVTLRYSVLCKGIDGEHFLFRISTKMYLYDREWIMRLGCVGVLCVVPDHEGGITREITSSYLPSFLLVHRNLGRK